MDLGTGTAIRAVAVAAVAGLLLVAQPAENRPPPASPGTSVTSATRVEYGWPTGEPAPVLRPFVAPPERWTAGHRGVDLALSESAAVLSAADGVVAFAGSVAGRGVVSVDHDDGVRTTYEPVAAVVRRGSPVRRGEVLGSLSGLGHCAPETCLHWGARRGRDDYLDPLGLVAQEPVIRLLPLVGGA